MPEKELLGVNGALGLSQKAMGELFGKYVNPGLKTLQSVVGFDKRFVRADGVSVYDEDGNRYLDFVGGYGCLPFGHSPKDILAALDEVKEVPNYLQVMTSPYQAALAHDLAQIAPDGLEITFFSNSGTEAVESALKLARGAMGEGVFVYCSGAFHGKTLGSLSVGGREKYKKPFVPLVPGTVEVPFGDAAALEKALRENKVVAFITEPIQGEGGVIVPPPGYLRKARELTEKYGALLILDEVQTGFARTGKMFAADHEGVRPDILCLAKALGGGVMPVGATMATKKVWERAYGGLSRAVLHTSTFGGGARACAAALATIGKIAREGLVEKSARLGAYCLDGLRTLKERYKIIEDVRGMGLLMGIEFRKPGGILDILTAGSVNKIAEEYCGALVASELMKRHRVISVYTLNNPNVIRLEPALIVEKEEIDFVLNALEDVLSRNKSFFSLAASIVRK
ncbi:MAG: aspartate aminotransferase family protein [Bacillota bacterium]|jgi:putrescine aminotransferase|nr:aspartate aminotransferase family protein [Candidatus Fermentithermobacillaceae bacterium]